MKTASASVVVALFLWTAMPAFAHEADEYRQAAAIAVGGDRVTLRLRLIPGAGVARRVYAEIDTDGDGTISDAEQRAYAERVRSDLSLAVDGDPLPLRLVSSAFPSAEEVAKGRGEVRLDFVADLPPGGSARRLTFENRHQSGIAAYLVNCLGPTDADTHIVAEERNPSQSFYRLDFTSGDAPAEPRGWLERVGGPGLIGGYVGRGVGHILTGYDHLLFVTALALAARRLWGLVKVVSAFTVAHSVTLTLAALNLVRLPEWVVEPVIAASIVFVALQNALRPKRSRGRGRLAAAFFFGLFHGLGFAGGLVDATQGLPWGAALPAIFGFSVGVEAGHLAVLLPLFAILTAVRRWGRGSVSWGRRVLALQRLASAGVAAAGGYFLYAALASDLAGH